MQDHRSADQLIEAMDGLHRLDCSVQRELFGLIARVDRLELWRDSGARDMAHWLWMRYGISEWKARRWIAASHALEYLPLISEAFSCGELGIDKVVELSRFATPEDVARTVAFLADPDQSAFVNGHTLSVDGGWFGDGGWESLRRSKRGDFHSVE